MITLYDSNYYNMDHKQLKHEQADSQYVIYFSSSSNEKVYLSYLVNKHIEPDLKP